MSIRPNMFSFDEVIYWTNARPSGNSYLGCCPAHDDKKPSLSISQIGDTLLLKCHAGCEFDAIITALRAQSSGYTYNLTERFPAIRSRSNDDGRKACAQKIWDISRPLTNAARAKAHFDSRNFRNVITNALRFHPNLRHPTNRSFPAVIAKVANLEGDLLGVHRTYLSHEGAGKAPVEPTKMMLGNLMDGAVHLAEAGRILMIGEGLETCLSAMQETSLPAWAALSASRFTKLLIPDCVREIIILADHDDAGITAAHLAGRRWKALGKRVRIAKPPVPGQDFNDVLQGEAKQ